MRFLLQLHKIKEGVMSSIFEIFEGQIGRETTEKQMQMKKLLIKMSEDNRMDDFIEAMLDETMFDRLMQEMEEAV
jgi:hypothetical protein